jgi:hypothetical protein
MARRKHPTDPTSDAAFESHLSTVTKLGLGMLILITMATTFSSSLTIAQPKFKRHLGAPVIAAASEKADSRAFECRGERAVPFSLEGMEKDLVQYLSGPIRGDDMEKLAEEYNAKNLAHDYYRFEFQPKSGHPILPNEPGIVLHPKSDTQGETLAELKQPDSKFRKHLEKLDKEKDVVILRVWPDSFAFFRDLRDWLQSEGYQISWHPVATPLQLLHPRFYGGGLDIDK